MTAEKLSEIAGRMKAATWHSSLIPALDRAHHAIGDQLAASAADALRAAELALADIPWLHAELTAALEKMEAYRKAVVWIYENGLENSRPDWVRTAISNAFEPVREARRQADRPPGSRAGGGIACSRRQCRGWRASWRY